MRRYLRRPGMKQISLPGQIGSEEFMNAYQIALNGRIAPKVQPGAARTVDGTINALAAAYYQHAAFLCLKSSTQRFYRGVIEGIRAEHGHRSVLKLDRDAIERALSKKATTPAGANNWLRVMHMLMKFAVSQKMRRDDPTEGIKRIRIKSDGFQIWPKAMIEKYRKRHAIGTKPRLAFELLYNTMQRRSDVVRMGSQHIRNEVLSIVQQKTGTQVDVPILPELRAAIDATPIKNLTFLTMDSGKPFTSQRFGNWFRQQCDLAGIPIGYAAHGLRKASATRLAESGGTNTEIMAWGGWKSITEVQRYTRAADRQVAAKRGAEKLNARTSSG